MEMPNVFVTPPEEDQVPTWCCFDAANPSLVERPEVISAITFSPDYSHPIQHAPTTSVLDDAIAYHEEGDLDDLETISDYGHELEDEPPPHTGKDIANDSDVVEVVKLRRNRASNIPVVQQEPQPLSHPPSKPSKHSLKSRASRAFKSLAGSLRSKSRTAVQDSVSSSSSRSSSQQEREEQPASRSRTPTALRRGSGILTQLFIAPVKARTSMSSDEPSPTTTATQPEYYYSNSAGQNSLHPRASSSSYEVSLQQDQARLQTASPAPTTSSRRSSRRFSKLTLQKLFLFGSSSSSVEINDNARQSGEPTPVLRSVTSTPAFSSSSSTSGPETPTSADYQIPVRLATRSSGSSMDEMSSDLPPFESLFDSSSQNFNLGLGLGINLVGQQQEASSQPTTPRKSTSTSMWGSITPKLRSRSTVPPPPAVEDTSLEIRLDSLHFDSLSFDIDRFAFQ